MAARDSAVYEAPEPPAAEPVPEYVTDTIITPEGVIIGYVDTNGDSTVFAENFE